MNVREWALPVYTILVQLAVGALFVLWMIRTLAHLKLKSVDFDRVIRNPILVIAATVMIGMVGAHFHLSRPYLSFLAILNIKTSWLSREILFSVLFFLTTVYLWYLTRRPGEQQKRITALGWLAITFGFAIVYTMAQIYLLPTQIAWDSQSVIVSFFTTSILLGAITVATLLVLGLRFSEIQNNADVDIHNLIIKFSFGGLALLILASVVVRGAVTLYQINMLQTGDAIASASLSLLIDFYLPILILRYILMIYAAFSLGFTVYRIYRPGSNLLLITTPVYVSCLLLLVGEILGRFLFYASHIRIGI